MAASVALGVALSTPTNAPAVSGKIEGTTSPLESPDHRSKWRTAGERVALWKRLSPSQKRTLTLFPIFIIILAGFVTVRAFNERYGDSCLPWSERQGKWFSVPPGLLAATTGLERTVYKDPYDSSKWIFAVKNPNPPNILAFDSVAYWQLDGFEEPGIYRSAWYALNGVAFYMNVDYGYEDLPPNIWLGSLVPLDVNKHLSPFAISTIKQCLNVADKYESPLASDGSQLASDGYQSYIDKIQSLEGYSSYIVRVRFEYPDLIAIKGESWFAEMGNSICIYSNGGATMDELAIELKKDGLGTESAYWLVAVALGVLCPSGWVPIQ